MKLHLNIQTVPLSFGSQTPPVKKQLRITFELTIVNDSQSYDIFPWNRAMTMFTIAFKTSSVPYNFKLTFAIAALLIALGTSGGKSAFSDEIDPSTYDPRFEFDLGGNATFLSTPTDWSSDRALDFQFSISMKVVNGVSIQGGKAIGFGGNPDVKMIDYGPSYQLLSLGPPQHTSTWGGIRLEIPASRIGCDIMRISEILCSAGIVRDTYHIRSREQRYYSIPYGYQTSASYISRKKDRNDRACDLDGYYIALAARWRLDSQTNATPEDLLVYHGIDAGLRYSIFPDHSRAYDTLEQPPSDFSSLQIFLNMYFKIDLLF